jgi:Cu/Ag efflux protein CusF
MLENGRMRLSTSLALVIALASLAFALSDVKRLNNVRKSFDETKSELEEIKSKLAASQVSQWPKFYDVNGKLLFKPGRNKLIIDHEEIPKVMPPMIMTYEVEDTKQIENLEPGDKVHFRLKETADKLFIVNIEKTK